jgi:hypothetical protein
LKQNRKTRFYYGSDFEKQYMHVVSGNKKFPKLPKIYEFLHPFQLQLNSASMNFTFVKQTLNKTAQAVMLVACVGRCPVKILSGTPTILKHFVVFLSLFW